jgi:hypothetical protein
MKLYAGIDLHSSNNCVKSEKTSNKKKKEKGNQKNGNKYLAWAFCRGRAYDHPFLPGGILVLST